MNGALGDVMSNKKKLKDILHEKDLRSTPTRLAILECLQKSDQPISVDGIFESLKKSKIRKNFDLVTLYRSVKTFEDAGVVMAVNLGFGKILYEYVKDEYSHHHHHIVCESCKKIEHLEVCGLDVHFKMLEGMGYRRLKHNLEFFGICSACA